MQDRRSCTRLSVWSVLFLGDFIVVELNVGAIFRDDKESDVSVMSHQTVFSSASWNKTQPVHSNRCWRSLLCICSLSASTWGILILGVSCVGLHGFSSCYCSDDTVFIVLLANSLKLGKAVRIYRLPDTTALSSPMKCSATWLHEVDSSDLLHLDSKKQT